MTEQAQWGKPPLVSRCSPMLRSSPGGLSGFSPGRSNFKNGWISSSCTGMPVSEATRRCMTSRMHLPSSSCSAGLSLAVATPRSAGRPVPTPAAAPSGTARPPSAALGAGRPGRCISCASWLCLRHVRKPSSIRSRHSSAVAKPGSHAHNGDSFRRIAPADEAAVASTVRSASIRNCRAAPTAPMPSDLMAFSSPSLSASSGCHKCRKSPSQLPMPPSA
mmetsp:Transcript_69988/g.193587  ORF Transcript_69988/g.193587 Transcript_69988/m.193587 type:complete len:219 (-) Transcript_69988:314-970(-)